MPPPRAATANDRRRRPATLDDVLPPRRHGPHLARRPAAGRLTVDGLRAARPRRAPSLTHGASCTAARTASPTSSRWPRRRVGRPRRVADVPTSAPAPTRRRACARCARAGPGRGRRRARGAGRPRLAASRRVDFHLHPQSAVALEAPSRGPLPLCVRGDSPHADRPGAGGQLPSSTKGSTSTASPALPALDPHGELGLPAGAPSRRQHRGAGAPQGQRHLLDARRASWRRFPTRAS